MSWHRAKQRQRQWSFFKGVLFFCLSLFLAFSLYSYNPEDPSLNSFGISLKVTNLCGYAGAFLADIFYQIFGVFSWSFVFFGCLMSWRSFKGLSWEFFMGLFSFLLLISGCCLLNLYFPEALFFKGSVSLGGAVGTVLLKGLKPLFHTLGTTVLLWSVLALSFVFYGQQYLGFILSGLWSLYSFLKKGVLKLSQGFWQILKRVRRFKKPITLESLFSVLRRKRESLEIKENKETPKTEVKPVRFAASKNNSSETKQPLADSTPFAIPATTFFGQDALPSLNLLASPPASPERATRQEIESLSRKLLDKFAQFSIEGQVTAVKTGPAVTLFEFKPQDNVKVSKIKEMNNDLSLALSSESVRIIAPIPGRDVVGIETSNSRRERVYLKMLLKETEFFKSTLPLALGKRADDKVCIEDLARIPHLLIAGTTGSGKSIFVISFITGLLFRHTPETLRLILVDPKQVDLSAFKGIPHLLTPPVISTPKMVTCLHWAISEMEKRYRSLACFGVRDLTSFNNLVGQLTLKEKEPHRIFNEANPQKAYYYERQPLIIIVIEEFGDLMADSQFKRPIENSVVRLAQKARASGIHLVLAMQSPRKDVVTGLIKTNIPGRISFKVASGTDSRVILDETGAENLLSHGDMLFLQPGTSKAVRFHGPFVSEKEVEQVVRHWAMQGDPIYEKALMGKKSPKNGEEVFQDNTADPMYEDIVAFVKECDVVSASFLQRKFRIGYPRAARMIEVLYEEGLIGPAQGSKPREVLGRD